jgi:hypothetical protein
MMNAPTHLCGVIRGKLNAALIAERAEWILEQRRDGAAMVDIARVLRVRHKTVADVCANDVAKQPPVTKLLNCTVTKFAASGYSQPRPIHVSLPPPPCGIVFTADRTETDPTARTIRDPNATWQRDRILASAGRVSQ